MVPSWVTGSEVISLGVQVSSRGLNDHAQHTAPQVHTACRQPVLSSTSPPVGAAGAAHASRHTCQPRHPHAGQPQEEGAGPVGVEMARVGGLGRQRVQRPLPRGSRLRGTPPTNSSAVLFTVRLVFFACDAHRSSQALAASDVTN